MAGLQKIKIPIKARECTIEKIKPYLSTVYNIFLSNARKVRADFDLYCLEHDINNKERPHDDDINNIVLSPHIRSMVEWKTGYTLGNPIKYAQSKSTQTDDITTLNKYIRNSNKMSIDKQVAEWAYATGVGFYFIQPKSTSFDVRYEAPFDIYMIDGDCCGKVYSSYLGNEPLFDFLYTELDFVDKNGTKTTDKILQIYLPQDFYEFKTNNGSDFEQIDHQPRGLYQHLPLVEMNYHNSIGISATARSLQNAIDKIASNGVDNIEDIVNEIWVFINATLGKTKEEKTTNLKMMKKMGAIELISASPDLPADIKSIVTKLDLTDVMATRAILLREMYDTNGVPQPSNSISSGNVTKGGGEAVNGYENAYNRALDDKNTFMPAQRELLKRIISICHKTPNCNIDELYESEIEIKYCFNMSDNMLTKTQSYVNLVQTGVPSSMALEWTKISNDSEADGAMIEENISKQAELQMKTNGGVTNANDSN